MQFNVNGFDTLAAKQLKPMALGLGIVTDCLRQTVRKGWGLEAFHDIGFKI
jgi:hypothetical protein